ncbi:hypothetical protein EIP91_008136 [Steccherinum ochraceum]|uniref:BTB domain-containing protein n=1 Tax=Steccherinum ochraceum TaxID=92696 RepID=A0A4R0RDF1_9APHY|nr:hypothetical protein EIP91_008136 [Steccherinum ochraceum]
MADNAGEQAGAATAAVDVAETKESEKVNFRKRRRLWYRDGNVIIVAEGVGFRVYRGILSKQSSVFKDIFRLPQGSSTAGQETYKGKPVIRVTDSSQDMQELLSILCGGTSGWLDGADQGDWYTTRSILRMSHKYEIDDLLEEGKRRLRLRFPGDLKSWDRLYSSSAIVLGSPSDAISMANMTRFLGLSRLHHRALYDCCQLDTDMLVNGAYDDNLVREVLCSEDIRACIDGRTKLAAASLRAMPSSWSDLVGPDQTSCTSNMSCMQAFIDLGVSPLHRTKINFDPLCPSPSLKNLSRKLCKSCAKHYIKYDTNRRQEILTNLHKFLKLPEPADSDSESEPDSSSDSDSSMDED